MSRLQQLQLRGCFRVTDAGLRSIGALVSLTALDLQECWQTTAAGLAGLSRARPEVLLIAACWCLAAILAASRHCMHHRRDTLMQPCCQRSGPAAQEGPQVRSR